MEVVEVLTVVFCGDQFPHASAAVCELLPGDMVVQEPLDRLRARPRRADVLVPMMSTVDAGLMDLVRPRLIQQFGVGVSGVDLGAARERGIPVAYVPARDTGNAEAVAEVAVLHALVLLRRYADTPGAVSARRIGDPLGDGLVGRTGVVVGLGAVGTAVIRRLAGFGMRLRGVGRRSLAECREHVEALGLEGYWPHEGLRDALSGADMALLCCPLTESTRGMIGAEELAAMAPGGHLVNVGRGPLTDYHALLQALREGRLAGAGLDVFWDEPIDPADPILRENVSVTPHIGAVTRDAYRAMADRFVANVERLRAGRALAHMVPAD